MKKFILMFVVIFIFVIVFMQSNVSDEDFVEAYESYYGITLPQPEQVEEIMANRSKTSEKGQWIYKLTYENQNVLNESENLREITERNKEEVKAELQQVFDHFNESVDDQALLKEMDALAIEVNSGDYYFSKLDQKKSGLFIYVNVEKNELYMLEWQ